MGLRRLPLEKTYNTRELGGFPISWDKSTRYKQFIRSDHIGACSQRDISYVKQYGVKVVIDLRNTNEREEYPNVFDHVEGIDYYHVPLTEQYNFVDDDVDIDILSFDQFYIEILKNYQGMHRLFQLLSGEYGGTILYHCTAGKDRTGVTTCILLMLAGVSIEDILADYQVSFTYIYPMLKELISDFSDASVHVCKSDPEWMQMIYHYIIKNYGSAKGYLCEIGLTENEINSLVYKMVDQSQAGVNF